MMRKGLLFSALAAVVFVLPRDSRAYPVGPPMKFDKMVQEADVIFKATAGVSRPTKDVWFKDYAGYRTFGTDMRLVSVLKGDLSSEKVVFLHYGYDKEYKGGYTFSPQLYTFQAGRSYIVFAKKTESPTVLRQMWNFHKAKTDQGAFLVADVRPVVADRTVLESVWDGLNHLLKSPKSEDVVYAIGQLDEMSNPHLWKGIEDFDREKVLAAIAGFIGSKDAKIASRAIQALASASPYRHENEAVFWLASVGKGNFPGIGKRDTTVKNVEGRKYWRELVAVANGDGPLEVRALAIRALGRAGEPKIYPAVCRWTEDPEPLVRKTAAILLADFPGTKTLLLLQDLSHDKAFGVRVGVAQAIGFGQFTGLLPVLERLSEDDMVDVKKAAALSIRSFGTRKPGQS